MTLIIYVFLICVLIYAIYLILKTYMQYKRTCWKAKNKVLVSVGFFHPYCNAGGGGERVLWCAIRAVQNRYPNALCVVYTGDQVPGSVILEKAEKSFNIKLLKPIEFIYLKRRNLIEAKNYPYFTLLLQSIGSLILGFEAASRLVPDIYIDTMGYAFTYPIFKHLCSCRVGAYVHYPTISTDMLSSVSEKKTTVNNRQFISQSRFLSYLKIFYYKMFAVLYSFVGRQAEVIMVNSSWTRNHILELWKKSQFTFTVYPPCDVSLFETVPLKSSINKKDLRIISIAQFRPEKNHELQLEAFKVFLNKLTDRRLAALVLIGSCRHEEDYSKVEELKHLCSKMGIQENVKFKLNLSFGEVIQEMKCADVSFHTMLNEHFGIGIVECMSAGLIMIAHDSGGPKLDIITAGDTGFLAFDANSYANALEQIWKMDSEALLRMRKSARKSVSRFSTEQFEKTFLSAISTLFMQ